jgi:hypothetical protein
MPWKESLSGFLKFSKCVYSNDAIVWLPDDDDDDDLSWIEKYGSFN